MAIILELKETVNEMVRSAPSPFAADVNAVSPRGGHRWKLGGQAQVPGVAGTWKTTLTESGQHGAGNLTLAGLRPSPGHHRRAPTRASRKITPSRRRPGDIAELKSTVERHGRPPPRLHRGGDPGQPARLARRESLGAKHHVCRRGRSWKDLPTASTILIKDLRESTSHEEQTG